METFDAWWLNYNGGTDPGGELKAHCRGAWDAAVREAVRRAERVAESLHSAAKDYLADGITTGGAIGLVRAEGAKLVITALRGSA